MRRQDIVQRLGRLLLFAGVLAVLGGRGLVAQTTTGTIRGYVKDPNGAPLSQRIARGSPIRPKVNDPIRRPGFPGQHPIETCPAFGRHFPFEPLAHLEL